MSTHADTPPNIEYPMTAAAIASAGEAARLLGAAGFVELPGMRTDGRVAHRTVGDFYELVIQFHTGHMQAIRQRLPEEYNATRLWFATEQAALDAITVWSMSGDPVEVTQELLALPPS